VPQSVSGGAVSFPQACLGIFSCHQHLRVSVKALNLRETGICFTVKSCKVAAYFLNLTSEVTSQRFELLENCRTWVPPCSSPLDFLVTA